MRANVSQDAHDRTILLVCELLDLLLTVAVAAAAAITAAAAAAAVRASLSRFILGLRLLGGHIRLVLGLGLLIVVSVILFIFL